MQAEAYYPKSFLKMRNTLLLQLSLFICYCLSLEHCTVLNFFHWKKIWEIEYLIFISYKFHKMIIFVTIMVAFNFQLWMIKNESPSFYKFQKQFKIIMLKYINLLSYFMK